MQNFYQLFGLPNFASFEDIQKAFNKMYADLFVSDSPLANISKLKELKDAFDILCDEGKRAEYDGNLRTFLENLEKQFDAAVTALSEGKHADSIQILKECLRINPRQPEFYETLGLAYQLSKQFDDAIRSFQQGLQLDKKNPMFHWYLGDLFRLLHEDEKADTHFLDAAEGFKETLKVDPRNLQAQELLADTYSKMKWFEEALEVYNNLLEQYPYKAEYHRDVGGVLYELEQLEDAEAHLLEALRNAPGDSSALLFLGLVYFKKRLLGLAIQTLDESLKSRADQPEVIQLLEKIRQIKQDVGSTVEEIINDPTPDAVVEGVVKWFNTETGIGVASCPEYPEVLLHFSALSVEDQDTLRKGDAIRFGVVKDKVGIIAVQVERIEAADQADTLPGTIIRFDEKRRIGKIATSGGREIVFPFASLSQDLLEDLKVGQEVLFEIKTILGLSENPIEQAINIRPRKRRIPPPPPPPPEKLPEKPPEKPPTT